MLTDVVTSDFLAIVFDELIGILPSLLPVTISLVAITKSVSWLKSTLNSA